MNPSSISLCVHQHFAGQFLRLNEGAIRLLHQQIPCELVVGGNGQEFGPIKDVPVRAFSAPQAGYNQARLAAMRHASAALGMSQGIKKPLDPTTCVLLQAAQHLLQLFNESSHWPIAGT